MTADRRDQILRAAGRAVLAEGFGRTSARDIARAIGVSPGLLHHYFPSMDTIRAAAIELFAEEDRAQLIAALGEVGSDPLARLDRLLRFAAPDLTDPSCRLWIDAWTEAFHNEAVRAGMQRLWEEWHADTTELIQACVDAGVADCGDPDASALRVLALLDGLSVQAHLFGTVSADQALAAARRTAELELGLEIGRLAALHDAGIDAPRVVAVGAT